jgi:hypothetical protein
MKNKFFKKRAELQISFAWLFAIIVGAFILFLAIYLSTKIIQTGERIQDAKTGKEIGVLLNPLEIGFESAKTTSITFPVDTRIYNGCEREGYFGRQLIKISQKSMNKWTDTNINVGFSNKYIFSERIVEGREVIVFSKPFEFPFKVSDLIYMFPSSKKFCFIHAPEEIKRELNQIGHKNILAENCSKPEFVKVCFDYSSGCDIMVNYNSGYVEKNNSKAYFYGDALMYAAIFSDFGIYECQLKRLMKRVGILSGIYLEKSSFVAREGCTSNLQTELTILKGAGNLDNSAGISLFVSGVEEAGNKNKNAICKLW